MHSLKQLLEDMFSEEEKKQATNVDLNRLHCFYQLLNAKYNWVTVKKAYDI